MATKIQLRRGTAAQWTSANPVLAQGEQALETDTGRRKVGDGSTAWASLAYDPPDAGAATRGLITTAAQTLAGEKVFQDGHAVPEAQALRLTPHAGNASWRLCSTSAPAPNRDDQVFAIQYNWKEDAVAGSGGNRTRDVNTLGSVSFQLESHWTQSGANPDPNADFEWNLDFGNPSTGAWQSRSLAFTHNWGTGYDTWKWAVDRSTWGLVLDRTLAAFSPRVSAPVFQVEWPADPGAMTTTSPGFDLVEGGGVMRLGFDNPGTGVAYMRSNVVLPVGGTRGIVLGHSLAATPNTYVNDLFIDLNNSRVGIGGNSTPTATLTVGAAGLSTPFMVDGVTGNCGIGVSAPTGARLHVKSVATVYGPSYWTGDDLVVGREPTSGASSGAIFLRWNETAGVGFLGSLAPGSAWKPLKLGSSSITMSVNAATDVAKFDANGTTIGASGTAISASIRATTTLSTGAIAAGATVTQNITVTGAAVGAEVSVGGPATLEAGLIQSAYVSATNTVTLRTANVSAAPITPAGSQTVSVRVFNP
jgi:hypothetical protein